MSGENRGRILFVFTESLKSLLIYFLSAWLFFDTVYGLLPLLPYAVFSIYRVARKTGQRQRELVTVQFKDVLGCMLTALEAGYSAEKSVESARADMTILHGNRAYMVKELEKRGLEAFGVDIEEMDITDKNAVMNLKQLKPKAFALIMMMNR